jgi:hypothetical protein
VDLPKRMAQLLLVERGGKVLGDIVLELVLMVGCMSENLGGNSDVVSPGLVAVVGGIVVGQTVAAVVAVGTLVVFARFVVVVIVVVVVVLDDLG